MAAIDWLPVVRAGMVSMWIELSFMIFFALGFVLLRNGVFSFLGPGNAKKGDYGKSSRRAAQFSSKSKKIIEAEASSGNAKEVLKAWRLGQGAPTPKELFKVVVQAFIDAEPESLVKEIVSHIKLHEEVLTTTFVAMSILDTVARSGKTALMQECWELLPEAGIKCSNCMYDVLLGGFATAGEPDKVRHYEAVMKRDRLKMSARGFSLVIKGYLKNGLVDEVLEKLIEMMRSGHDVPSFAVAQFLRVAAEAGRSAEMFAAVQSELDMSSEAFGVILEDCARTGNLTLAEEVEHTARSVLTPLPATLYDVLVKLYTLKCHSRAIHVFNEMQSQGSISEAFCVSLLARCAESKFLSLAEEVVKYCRSSKVMTLSIYSSLMKVYAFSGLYDKACDLYEDIQKDKIEPDAMMYGCLMKFAVECGRNSLLEDLADKVPTLDIQHYMSLIRSAGCDRDVNRAFAVFERLKCSSLAPDVASFNCVLDACVRSGDLKRAQELMKEMRERKMVDIITYNTLIKGWCSKGDLKAAKAMIQLMEAEGIKANDVSYNSMVNAAVIRSNFLEAWAIVDTMEAAGVRPDHYTVSIMMKALKKIKGGHSHVARCFALLDRSGVDICQDEILLNTVLETCTRHRETKRLESMLCLFEKSKLRPSTPTYGSIIKAYGTLRCPEKCWAYWREMIDQRGLKPTHIVIGCMLDALVSNGLVDDAERLFAEYDSSPPNMVLYSILFKGFANTHQPQRAMDLWRETRQKGMQMNTVGYNSVIDSQARAGNMEEVSEILKVMAEEGVKPDSITHSVIVKAYCVRGELESAMATIRSMQECKMEHDAVVYNTCLDACSKQSRLDLVDKLLKDMVAHDISPTNFTLGILVKTFARAKQLDKVFEIMETLPKLGHFVPNQQVWMCLLCSCLNNDAPDKALEVLADMRANGHPVDSKVYQVLISGLVKHGWLQEAVKLVDQVYGLGGNVDTDCKPSDGMCVGMECLEALFSAIAQKGLRQHLGLPLLERFRAAQLPVSGRILNCAFAITGDYNNKQQKGIDANRRSFRK
ncbi:unnamed protein product [Effrenium voratum]|nr:unnamed protein product [Effrenium voratum]